MNTPVNPTPRRSGHHPAMILAAIAVILFCLVGTAAILGWIPSSIGGAAPRDKLSDFDRAALAAKMQEDSNRAASPALVMAPGELPPAAPAAQLRDTAPLERSLAEPAPVRERVVEREVEEPAPRKREPVRVAEAKLEKDWCRNCGNVESVRAIKQRAEGSGLGAGAGAVLGGLLGNQIGGGNGRKLATVAGAVGGAVVGNQVEGNMKASTSYEIRVRLDDGSARTFHQQSAPRWEAGDRVRIVNGALRSAA